MNSRTKVGHKKPKRIVSNAAQSLAFIEKARELSDEGSSHAEELMGRLAKMPPEPKKSATSKRPS
jgi:hypothetical protein